MLSTRSLITQAEAAERLNVSVVTLRRWVREGRVRGPIRIGRNAYYQPETIRDFITEQINTAH